MTVDDNETVEGAQGSVSSGLLYETESTRSSGDTTGGVIWKCSVGQNCEKDTQKYVGPNPFK